MTWLGDIRALGVPEVARRLGVRVQYPLFVLRGVQAEAQKRGGGWKVETFGAWA